MVGWARPSDRKGRANAGAAGDFDPSGVRIHNGFANGEAQPGTAIAAIAGLFGAIKAIKDARQFFGFNADARVGNDQENTGVVTTRGHLDFAIDPVVPDRIRQQICDGTADVVGVSHHRRGLELAADLDTALGGERPDEINALLRLLGQVQRLAVHWRLVRIKARQLQQGLGQARICCAVSRQISTVWRYSAAVRGRASTDCASVIMIARGVRNS